MAAATSTLAEVKEHTNGIWGSVNDSGMLPDLCRTMARVLAWFCTVVALPDDNEYGTEARFSRSFAAVAQW